MKYLIFSDPEVDYGATFNRVRIASVLKGFGSYEDKDADILLKLHPTLVQETTEETFEFLKKKLSHPPATYKNLRTVEQDPSKDPNAVYAKADGEAQSKPKKAKSLVKVGKAKVKTEEES